MPDEIDKEFASYPAPPLGEKGYIMSEIKVYFAVLFFFIFILFASTACNNKSPLNEDNTKPIIPPLVDNIPYESLGQGKIIFERGDPSGNYSGVYVLDLENQNSQRLRWISGPFRYPCISPDGQKVAFTRFADLSTAYDVHVSDIDGENIQNISQMEVQDSYPSWSPDGTKILFLVGPYQGLVIQSPVANPADRVVVGLGSIVIGRVSVSNTGKIVFADKSGIRMMLTNNTNISSTYIKNNSDTRLESPVFSPDGQKIAYIETGFETPILNNTYNNNPSSMQILIRDVNDRTTVSILEQDITGSQTWTWHYGWSYYSLCWSPDGTKLLFCKPEGDNISHIYLINVDGSGLTTVTSADSVSDINISWSR